MTSQPKTHLTNAPLRRKLLAAGTTVVATAALPGSATRAAAKPARKDTHIVGVPWERQYGYVQAVKVGDWLYVSGQLSHDAKGDQVAPAALDASGKVTDFS